MDYLTARGHVRLTPLRRPSHVTSIAFQKYCYTFDLPKSTPRLSGALLLLLEVTPPLRSLPLISLQLLSINSADYRLAWRIGLLGVASSDKHSTLPIFIQQTRSNFHVRIQKRFALPPRLFSKATGMINELFLSVSPVDNVEIWRDT